MIEHKTTSFSSEYVRCDCGKEWRWDYPLIGLAAIGDYMEHLRNIAIGAEAVRDDWIRRGKAAEAALKGKSTQ